MVLSAVVLGALVLGRLVAGVPSVRHLGPRSQTALLGAALAVPAAGLTVWSLGSHRGQVFSEPLLVAVLTVTFFMAEQFLVNIEFRRQSHSLTCAGVPLAIGVMVLPVHE